MSVFDSAAASVLSYAMERSVAFAVVLIVVGAVWLLVCKWMSSHAGSVWFLLPLVVLVAPVERLIPSPWASSNPIESAAMAMLPESVERVFVDPTTEGFLEFTGWTASEAVQPASTSEVAQAQGPSTPGFSLPWTSVLFAAWLLGLGAFLYRLASGQRMVPALLAIARELDPDTMIVDMEQLRIEANVKEPLRIFESPDFESPAVWTGEIPGEARNSKTAAIILPEGLSARLSERELQWVLLHELAHLARRDHKVELVQRVLGAAFFFHPLVWAANRIARGYREMACDDAALARCAKDDRARCARALFEVVAHASALASRPTVAARKYRTTHAMASLFYSKTLTRKRIMRLIEIDRPLARGLRITALLPVLLVSGVALAAARFPAVVAEASPVVPVVLDDELEIMDHNEMPGNSIEDARVAVLAATDWLLANQDKDGGWHYTGPVKANAVSNGEFEPYHTDAGLTGLALQALTRRAKYEPDNKELAKAIEGAVANLIARQDKETGYFGKERWAFMVGQALATEALAKASLGNMTAERMASLKLALMSLEHSRNPYGAWRYDDPPTGQNDTRVTGYVMLAIASLADAGIKVSSDVYEGAQMIYWETEDKATGRTHYMNGAEFAYRLRSQKDAFPSERAEAPTAMHMRLRNATDRMQSHEGAIAEATTLLSAKSPFWSVERGTIDYTYWWQGTEALASSPNRGESWDRWSLDLRTALLERQDLTQGDSRGTWPLSDAWSGPGLEVYTTATCALALYAVLDAE